MELECPVCGTKVNVPEEELVMDNTIECECNVMLTITQDGEGNWMLQEA